MESQRVVYQMNCEETLYIERLYYISKSCENIVAILCRELKERPNKETSDMLDKYISDCKTAFITLSLAQNELVKKYHGHTDKDMEFNFDFETGRIEGYAKGRF